QLTLKNHLLPPSHTSVPSLQKFRLIISDLFQQITLSRTLKKHLTPISQSAHRLDNLQPGVHGAPGVVFVGLGIAEIDHETITKVLGDVPIKALDHQRIRYCTSKGSPIR